MKTFIVAIPLFNRSMSVEAYRLSNRNGEKLFGVMDDYRGLGEALLTPGLDMVEQLGVEPFAGDKPLFVDINEYQLLMGKPADMDFPPARLVCAMPGNITQDDAVTEKLNRLKKLGYKLALDGLPLHASHVPWADLLDYIILDYRETSFFEDFKIISPFIKTIATVITNVPDMEAFAKLATIPGALVTGSFYNQPITQNAGEISPLKVNALQLLRQINTPDFDLTTIAHIIERDPSLSISLLRFINTSVKLARKIESIRSAVAILGQREVKRWATVAISIQLADDRPGEIIRLSLMRAKFAENLATAYELGIFAPSLFMAGLFSLIDVVLQKPMAAAISEVAVDDKVKAALLDRTGELFEVLDLIYAYERGDWDRTSINMVRNDVNVEKINSAYLDALVWYKDLLDSLGAEDDGEDAGSGE